MEFMLVIRDGEWKPCAYFIDGKRVSKEAYNIMEYEIQTHGVADCFLTRRSRNGHWLHSFSGRLIRRPEHINTIETSKGGTSSTRVPPFHCGNGRFYLAL